MLLPKLTGLKVSNRAAGLLICSVLSLEFGILASACRADLFVSNRYPSQVLRYDGDTGILDGAFGPDSGLSEPTGLVFGPGGDLFVAAAGLNQVLRYDGGTGTFKGVFASGGGMAGPYDILFGPSGDLFVANFFLDQVLRFDGVTGAPKGVFASGGGLDAPSGLAFGPGGDLFVASAFTNQVLRYDGVTGAFEGAFASGAELGEPHYLAFSPVPEPSCGGDFNGDGDVDGRDFLLWQRDSSVGNLVDWHTNYGAPLGAAAAAVPEPAAIYMLFIVALICPPIFRENLKK